MKQNAKNIVIASIAGLAVISGIIYYGRERKKALYQALLERIGSGSLVFADYSQFLNENFHRGVVANISGVLQTSEAEVQRLRKELKAAVDGVGTNEEKIYTAFESTPDLFAVSQVSESYKKAHNESLYERLRSELNGAEQKKVAEILSYKPEFRYL